MLLILKCAEIDTISHPLSMIMTFKAVMNHRSACQVVWFKRDLRIEDHTPLAHAARQVAVVPLFVVEPEIWHQPDMSGRQWAFVAECLEQLRSDLKTLGQPLVVRVGAVVGVLDDIHRTLGIEALWSHEETGNFSTYQRDLDVKAWCHAQGVPWHEPRQFGVTRKLRSRKGWAKEWDRFMATPKTPSLSGLTPLPEVDLGAIPNGNELGLQHDPCPQRQIGGRKAGLDLLDGFLTRRGETYRQSMSSPVTAFDHCSRLSPYLAWGVLSMREVAQATWGRQLALRISANGPTTKWRGALTSFSGRLHWHCHFIQKLEDEPRIEFENLHAAYDGLRPSVPDRERLVAWANGETGLPFVDDCMRALKATGWMNFRMRAMLMAVASYHLWLDWRQPGEHLARQFTDYEPGIHWPQVQMQSETTGINTVRIYNPVKQGYDQDPEGLFLRRWLPELADVPLPFLHEPWTWDRADRVLGKTYPFPIIDHLAAAKEARQKVWAVRRGLAFRDQAATIQNKHGSRKSGMSMRGQRVSSRTKQMQLDLDGEGKA